jgi:DNA polymerase/3'-5' exonuclease PolX
LYKDYEKAIEKDDMPWAVQIKEEIENNQRVIHQNALNITQEAYQQVSAIQLIGNDLISASITPRTHRWSWKVDDMDLLFSKKPELVELSPNTKAINKFMKEKVDADELSSDTDNIFDGLILYRKPFYVGVKTKGEKEEEDAA